LEASPTHLQTNQLAQAAVTTHQYVDMHELLCGSSSAPSCPIFDERGRLLSYDGAHLTQSGAQYVAQRLASDEAFAKALGAD
jgi:hypothetical protein